MSRLYNIIKAIIPKPKANTFKPISSVEVGKNLTKKRKIQDEVVASKDKIMKDLSPEHKVGVRTNVPLKDNNKEIAKILDKPSPVKSSPVGNFTTYPKEVLRTIKNKIRGK